MEVCMDCIPVWSAHGALIASSNADGSLHVWWHVWWHARCCCEGSCSMMTIILTQWWFEIDWPFWSPMVREMGSMQGGMEHSMFTGHIRFWAKNGFGLYLNGWMIVLRERELWGFWWYYKSHGLKHCVQIRPLPHPWPQAASINTNIWAANQQ